ncbi:MAG: putative Rossmann-fold nucleotide-binding protein [Pseudohongiellaceae bacterium]|jgi:predicted Rossmann-fold nucleotide-binding protein
MSNNLINSEFSLGGLMGLLSKSEVSHLLDSNQGGLYKLFRNCCLAVLNCGSQIDDSKTLLDQYRDFDVRILQQERGIKLQLSNAPAEAFVDGEIIQGIREHLAAVVRDIIHGAQLVNQFDLNNSHDISDMVFHMLRNGNVLQAGQEPNLIVCWGGHSISREEYDYTKDLGYQLGLRMLDVCTGCGPGAMKGPMKGATIGRAKQRGGAGRYIGLTEPGIIAAESPNPIVNELVILPDIEKRLEAFVRCAHGIIIFPGGAGTMEELLYLLGIMLHPKNTEQPLPIVLTGPASSADYYAEVDAFIHTTLGEKAQSLYQIIIDDAAVVANIMFNAKTKVRDYRKEYGDAYHFNWMLHIDADFQRPFIPSHDNMKSLNLHRDQPAHTLAADLRRAFSGIVAGNVKEEGILAIEQHGVFEIEGEKAITQPMDRLLTRFIKQQRMKLPGTTYNPCYRVIA